ncbi:hypothetical protein [Hymenobacter ginkgonis]|uniref:hypothetical protein n=1 Tax=Hymenobacter ginkgonis TaxID=2682976 RepID=UPI0037426CCE
MQKQLKRAATSAAQARAKVAAALLGLRSLGGILSAAPGPPYPHPPRPAAPAATRRASAGLRGPDGACAAPARKPACG